MNETNSAIRKISTGEDSTLKTWINLATILYGENSKPVTFLKDKAATATHGEDEEVIADERQVMLLLAQMYNDEQSILHGEDNKIVADEHQAMLHLGQMYKDVLSRDELSNDEVSKEVHSRINQFGVWCREFRIERNEILRDMAHKLDLNVARLNAMENDRYPIDHDIADRIEKVYALDEKQLDALKVALNFSPNYKIRKEEDIHGNRDNERTEVDAEEYRIRQLRTYGIRRVDDQG